MFSLTSSIVLRRGHRIISTTSQVGCAKVQARLNREASIIRQITTTTSTKQESTTTESKDQPKKKKTNRPARIILIRHGESQGNVDASTYVTTPDWRVPLTPKGIAQASKAGEKLRNIIGDKGQVFFYCSPYKRTVQTLQQIEEHLCPEQIISAREEPRISEQQFGNFQDVEEVLKAKAERHDFGRFYYRFRSGEAGLDVYSRVSSFISTLVRDCQQYQKAGYDLDNISIVIIMHGLSLRLFLMRWFQFSVEEFERSQNPLNAQLVVMDKKCVGGHRWYQLDSKDRESLSLPESCGLPKNVQLHHLSNAVDDNQDDNNSISF